MHKGVVKGVVFDYSMQFRCNLAGVNERNRLPRIAPCIS